jgi:predicted  nucleic acid-binding Zn-ribbon protein
MSPTKAPLSPAEQCHKLASAKRSRAKLEDIQTLLAEIKDNTEPLDDLTQDIQTLNNSINSVRAGVDAVDNSIMPSQYASELTDALDALDRLLPGDDDAAMGVRELIDTAIETADDYESSLDDTEMSAEDREEIWGTLQDQLTEVGNGLDSFQTLGSYVEPESKA